MNIYTVLELIWCTDNYNLQQQIFIVNIVDIVNVLLQS